MAPTPEPLNQQRNRVPDSGPVLGGGSESAALAERRLELLRDLRECSLTEANSVEQACRAAATALANKPHDVPFALLYLLDQDGRLARLVETVHLATHTSASPTAIAPGSPDDVWGFRRVIETQQSYLVENIGVRFGSLPAGQGADDQTTCALVLPLANPSLQELPLGLLVMGVSPRLPLDDDYRGFLELAGQQLAIALSRWVRPATGRSPSEEALRESERRFRTVFEQAAVGIAQFETASGRFLRVNQRYADIVGYTPEELLARSFQVITHPDDLEPDLAQMRRLVAGEIRAFTMEKRYFHKGGEIVWVRLTVSAMWAPGELPDHHIAVVEEITAAKLAEEALREAEERVRLAMEASQIFSWEVDVTTGRSTVSGNWAELLGFAEPYRPQNVFAAIAMLLPLEDAVRFATAVQQTMRGEGDLRLEYRVIHPDTREVRWIEASATLIRSADGQPLRVVGIAQHITERKRTEEALHSYTRRVQKLNTASLALNAAPTGASMLPLIAAEARTLIGAGLAIVTLVPDNDWSRTQTAASLAEAFTARQDDAALLAGGDIGHRVHSERRSLRLTQAELDAEPAWHAFSAAHMAPGRLDGLVAAPLIGSDSASIGVIQLAAKIEGSFTAADEALLAQLAQLAAVALENRSLYEQEQAARQEAEEASRLKDEFLATVSHELRTPLTALLGYAQLLQTRKRDEAYIARTVEKIIRSAKDQALIIEDLLDASRIVTGKLRIAPQPISLIAVVQAAVETVQPAIAAKALRLSTELSPEADAIVGDANRLQQVVWNLLSNAAKFTPPGGSITVQLARAGRDAELSVRDTGRGISPEFLPFVFDRFRQAEGSSSRSHGGLGLGLAIVRHLVERHGGTVAAASDGEGLGARFTVRLPLSQAGETAAPQAAGDAGDHTEDCPPELRGLRVLVVDDQPALLELLDEMLAPCHSVVRHGATAREGLALLRDWRPDVLVSDIAMPGEDGYWLIAQVRALPQGEGGSTPALALTAFVGAEERARVLAAGFQLYVPKPVEPAELRGLLAHLARLA